VHLAAKVPWDCTGVLGSNCSLEINCLNLSGGLPCAVPLAGSYSSLCSGRTAELPRKVPASSQRPGHYVLALGKQSDNNGAPSPSQKNIAASFPLHHASPCF